MPTEQPTRKSAKDIVKEYLHRRAAEDQLFAASYAKPAKNIDDCWNYILSVARGKGAAVCMSDQEVFGLAVHYYDEDNIKVSPVSGARVSTSNQPRPAAKLTAKEKAAAKEEAKRLYMAHCLAEQEKANARAKKPKPAPVEQTTSLFDFDF